MQTPENEARIEKAARWIDALLNEAGREILRELACAEIERIQREEPEIDHDALDRRAGNFVAGAAMRTAQIRAEREAKKFRN